MSGIHTLPTRVDLQLGQGITNGVNVTSWQTILTERLRTCLTSVQKDTDSGPGQPREVSGYTGKAFHRIARYSDCTLRSCADYMGLMRVSSAALV